ncbi:MAG: hypothetical protein WAO71_07300 [Gallionella sp.]
MNETRLCTIEQIEQFLSGCAEIEFSQSGDDNERYEHIKGSSGEERNPLFGDFYCRANFRNDADRR